MVTTPQEANHTGLFKTVGEPAGDKQVIFGFNKAAEKVFVESIPGLPTPLCENLKCLIDYLIKQLEYIS